MLTITQDTIGEVTVLLLKGSLMGEPETSQFHENKFRLVESGRLKLVLDLSELKMINSFGLGALIAALVSTRKKSGDIRLAGVSKEIDNVIQTVQLGRIFKIYKTVEESVASFY
jgi:anti-sigma B factor antagonist